MSRRARAQGSIDVRADAEQVWALVSDLPGMGRFSPEATGGSWVRGGGPVVGAVFVGKNANGARTWSTRSTVVAAEPGRRFAFEVTSSGAKIARWEYEIEPTGTGCRVTESWQDRRGRGVTLVGQLLTGTRNRPAFTATSIERTLQQVKALAETQVTPDPSV